MTRRCDNCKTQVTGRYWRVFSDNHGVLHSCQYCKDKTGNHAPVDQDSGVVL